MCMGLIVFLALISIFFKLDKEDKIYIIVMISLATMIMITALVNLPNYKI
jgi:hypothetical protein